MRRNVITGFLLCTSLLFPFGQSASALPTEQKKIYNLGVYAFDVDPGVIGAKSGCSITVNGGAGLSGTDNSEKVWHFLVAKGLTPIAAAGVMGNLIQEDSSFDPALKQNYSLKAIPDAGDGKTGFGIEQWTSANRQAGLFAKIKAAGLDKYYGAGYGHPEKDKDIPVDDVDKLLEIELNYAWEGDTSQIKSFVDKLNATTSVEGEDGSALLFHSLAERSGDDAEGKQQRINSAKNILAKYGGAVDSGGGLSGAACGAQLGGVNSIEDALPWAKRFVDDTTEKYNPGGHSLDNVKNIDGSISTWFTKDGVVGGGGGCWGATYCGQCVAASGWFVTNMTDYDFSPGNGGDLVANLKAKGVATGKEPKPFSIFSTHKTSSSAGHTGIVLGVLSDHEVITLENNASGPGILTVYKKDLKAQYSDVEFAYVGDKLKSSL